jgi:outer membrane protein assembly factor BamB
MRKWVLGFVLVMSIFLSVNAMASEKLLWEAQLPQKMAWNQLTFAGTLLVGSTTSITSYNPDTGKEMWHRDDLTRTAPFNVREITGFPILVVSDYAGMAGSQTQLYGINLVTGENIWQTEKMMG